MYLHLYFVFVLVYNQVITLNTYIFLKFYTNDDEKFSNICFREYV